MYPLFAAVELTPGGFISWLIVGLVSGFLAGKVMSGGGFGMIGDLIVGLIGAFIGGITTSLFIQGQEGFIGSIFVSFIGACILIALTRVIKGKPAV